MSVARVEGHPMVVKFPSFETRDAAVAYATDKGFAVHTPSR